MKILFLTYFYYDIYKPILEEMKRQGHDVTVIEDKFIPHDYHAAKVKGLIGHTKKFINNIIHPRPQEDYWCQMIKDKPEINDFYDALVCQPGLSFCPYLIEILKKKNPIIKSCVMIHDSSNYYNHYYYKDLYDHVYTFDYDDAKNIEGVELLGAYWVPTEKTDIKYDIVLIGSDHDDRFEIVRKLYPQIEEAGLNSYIRIVSKEKKTEGTFRKMMDIFVGASRKRRKEWEKRMSYSFMTDKPIAIDNVQNILNSSNCILETDREGQAGLTLRDMWALSSGKKIVTTNTFIKQTPYYNPDQVRFIDREKPVLDIDFIKENKIFSISNIIIQQRIDNWVLMLLSFN